MFALLPLIPVAFLGVLMMKHKRPVYISAMAMLGVMLTIAIMSWRMEGIYISASLAKSLFVSLEIALIVWGASILLGLIQRESFSLIVRHIIGSITHDRRIQAILIGWIFVSFIEGIAGFGTPALLAVPLLILFGFSPISSIVVSLLGDSAAVTFGAVGTPIIYGIAQGSGLVSGGELIMNITRITALINGLVGWIIPLAISYVIVTLYGRPIREGLKIFPYIILSWLCFFIPYIFTAFTFGPEFPSIVGSLVGGIILVYLTKKKVFVPKVPWRFPHEDTDPPIIRFRQSLKGSMRIAIPLLSTVLVLAGLKALSFTGLGMFISDFLTIGVSNIFGSEISHTFSILKSPFIAFVIAILISWPFMGMEDADLSGAMREATSRMGKIIIAMFAVVGVVQLFMYSGYNISGLPAMPELIISQFSWLGPIWTVMALFFGVFGSFMAGSATVSNLLLGPIHMEFVSTFGLSTVLILSLQAVGSAIGNMVSMHNVVVASSIAKLDESKEGKIIVYNMIPLVIYAVLAVIVGLILAGIGII